jgi:hypothetical protein
LAKLPKLWRKKRGDRFVGSWHATVSGADVNLRTSDAEEARKRLRAAVERGRRNFDDEQEAAADLENAQPLEAPATPGPAAAAPAAPVAAPPAPPPSPDPTPPPTPDAGDVDDMAAAAADVAGAANDNAAAEVLAEANPEVLDAFLEQGAAVIVDAQLQLQAYLIKRRTGLIAGEVPQDSQLRTGAAKAWAAQLKVWFPSAVALPPWAMAVVLPVLAVPVQLAGAKKPEDVQADRPGAAAA